jgi:RNA polymerase sigma-70 factor, ECF subfamily
MLLCLLAVEAPTRVFNVTEHDAPPLESTRSLVLRAQEGDQGARSRLTERCLPLLRRWARGRLPLHARDLSDTDDLVQTTLVRALEKLDVVRVEHRGSFLAYLRTVLLNAVRDEARRTRRRRELGLTNPRTSDDDEAPPPEGVTPAIEPATVLDYERALGALPEPQRQAVILRLEFGLTYPEIALELDAPSANAVRMMLSRAMVQLSRALS